MTTQRIETELLLGVCAQRISQSNRVPINKKPGRVFRRVPVGCLLWIVRPRFLALRSYLRGGVELIPTTTFVVVSFTASRSVIFSTLPGEVWVKNQSRPKPPVRESGF